MKDAIAACGRQMAFAFRLFTRIPSVFALRLKPGDISHSSRWFTLVGFIEGGLLIILLYLLGLFVSNEYLLAATALLIRMGISRGQVRGAAHAMDGLFDGKNKVETVEIMLSPGFGGMGVAVETMDLILRFTLYKCLFSSMNTDSTLPILLVSCMAGKLAVNTAIGTSNSVFRRDRLIDDGHISSLFIAIAFSSVLVYYLLGLPVLGLFLILEISIGLIMSGSIVLKLGGLTKQTLYLMNEIGEIAFLFTMLIW